MIHQYKNNGYNIVMDVNSGSVHCVDDAVYDVVEIYDKEDKSGYRRINCVPEIKRGDVLYFIDVEKEHSWQKDTEYQLIHRLGKAAVDKSHASQGVTDNYHCNNRHNCIKRKY